VKARAIVLVAAVSLALSACASLFESDAERESRAREQEAAARRAELEATRQAAVLYAAIVYFPLGGAQVDEAGLRELGWFVEQMRSHPTARFDVQGFTDSLGGDTTNTEIATRRVEAVASALGALGIAQDRLILQALGEQAPAATNRTAEGRRNNRRVEVTVHQQPQRL